MDNVWSNVKKTLQETWPLLPLRNDDYVKSCGMDLLHLTIVFVHNWVHTKISTIYGCRLGIMDIIVEKPGLQTKQQFYDETLELE